MPKLQRAKTVACGLLRWDRCCIIVVSHWSKPAGQNMASLLVVVGFRTSHSMPKEESHVIFSKNLPLKAPRAPLRRDPPPSCDACPAPAKVALRRAPPCCGPLGRAAAARWVRCKSRGQGVAAGGGCWGALPRGRRHSSHG